MTTNAPEPATLSAILLQLAELAGKLAAADTREAEHWAQVTERLTALGRAMSSIRTEGHLHGEALAELAGMPERVADLDARVRILAGRRHDEEGEAYEPTDNVSWHKIEGEERVQAVARLRSWSLRVFIPGYGVLADRLPTCWEKHPFCLYTLDYLSELWSVLYLNQKRSAGMLASQADFTTRLLPAAVRQMAEDAADCGHAATRLGAQRSA